MLLSEVVAQQEQGQSGGMWTILLPVALLVVFWFVLIRPQRKKQRQVADMQRNIEVGQRVMTGAGMISTVAAVEDDEVILEIAPGVHTRFAKQAIVRNLEEPTNATEPTATGEEEPDSDEGSTSDDLPVTHDDGRKNES